MIYNLQLLMVFGHLGHPGLTVAKNVGEEHQQEQEPAVVKNVEENLALEITLKIRLVMRNVAVSIIRCHVNLFEH